MMATGTATVTATVDIEVTEIEIGMIMITSVIETETEIAIEIEIVIVDHAITEIVIEAITIHITDDRVAIETAGIHEDTVIRVTPIQGR